MMAPPARSPDRQSRQLYALLLAEIASFIGLNASGLLVITEVSHNARPLLATTWCLLTAAILVSLVAVEWQIVAAKSQGSGSLAVIRRIILAILGAGSVALLATLLTMLANQPDPSLYRVPSAVAAARVAFDALPTGTTAHIVAITSIPSVTGESLERAWHVSLESDRKPTRTFDVTVDAKSGETYRYP